MGKQHTDGYSTLSAVPATTPALPSMFCVRRICACVCCCCALVCLFSPFFFPPLREEGEREEGGRNPLHTALCPSVATIAFSFCVGRGRPSRLLISFVSRGFHRLDLNVLSVLFAKKLNERYVTGGFLLKGKKSRRGRGFASGESARVGREGAKAKEGPMPVQGQRAIHTSDRPSFMPVPINTQTSGSIVPHSR